MKLKNLLITLGLSLTVGAGVAVGVGTLVKEQPKAAEALTQGQWRLNILVNTSSWWTNDNTRTVVWTGSQNVILNYDSDLGHASDSGKSQLYTKTTVNGTTYYLATIETSCPASSTTMYFKRCWSDSTDKIGDNERSISISSTNNTLLLDSNTSASSFGNVFKVKLHTGLDSATTSTSFIKASSSNYNPANPSGISGYSFAGWYTNSAKTSAYTPAKLTGDLELWAKYTEDTYKVSVGGGSAISMSTTDHVEYTANITASAGQTVTFTKNNTAYSFTPENASNNNYCANGFRFGGTFSIYLKTDSNPAQLWAGGMPTSADSIYYLMVNGIGDGLMVPNSSNPSEVQKTGVHFYANDAINILNVSNNTTYTYKNPALNDASVTGFSKSGDNIICGTAGYYDLYYNFNSNSLYFGESSSSACVTFSENFTVAVGENTCKYNPDTQVVTTVLSELKAEWVNQYAAWIALGEANQYAQGIMRDKDSSEDDELGRCVRLYDYIVGKYGSELNGTYQGQPFSADFMGRNPAQISQSSLRQLISNDNTNIVVVVVVILSIGVLTVSAYYFFKKSRTTEK